MRNFNDREQGDVYFRKISDNPSVDKNKLKDYKQVQKTGNSLILALGEVTGHHHSLLLDKPTIDNKDTAVLYRKGEGTAQESMILVVKETSNVVHQEHGTIVLEPGVYDVGIQTEYDPEGERRVLD